MQPVTGTGRPLLEDIMNDATGSTAVLDTPVEAQDAPQLEAVELDLLVEDVSIDGMCGVY